MGNLLIILAICLMAWIPGIMEYVSNISTKSLKYSEVTDSNSINKDIDTANELNKYLSVAPVSDEKLEDVLQLNKPEVANISNKKKNTHIDIKILYPTIFLIDKAKILSENTSGRSIRIIDSVDELKGSLGDKIIFYISKKGRRESGFHSEFFDLKNTLVYIIKSGSSSSKKIDILGNNSIIVTHMTKSPDRILSNILKKGKRIKEANISGTKKSAKVNWTYE